MEFWSEENTKRLRELFDLGHTGRQIGIVLGFTRNAIIGKLNRLGLKRATSTDLETRKQQRQEGKSRNSGGSFPPRLNRARQAQPLEREATPSPSSAPPSLNISLFQLEHGRCRWPEGDPREPGFGFCGHQTYGPVYCFHHAARAYNRNGSNRS